ncbi:hypothetical protein LZ578_08825 [Jeotgalibaca sp. MA1X17-3]|uniref:hypothetical protein n=1 Tax=Jeotgalibaca sp. MA1X17-3 TaxID=2908211 RepID=UPI001F33ACFD|nr:hypothetical protein [Jeotgalibaca sp. MA1X17-3]UJF15101.1 hypothetical protein LZ578_08825 [Jeotgalibaca sp. MA1X17-3]
MNGQMDRIIKLYTLGSVEIDTVDKMMSELKTKKDSLLKKKLSEEETIPPETVEMIRSFDWENASLQEKIGVIDILIHRIDIDDQDLSIHLDF